MFSYLLNYLNFSKSTMSRQLYHGYHISNV